MMMVVMSVVLGKSRHGCAEQQNTSQYGDYGLLHCDIPPANAPWSAHSVSSTLPVFFPWAKVYFFDTDGNPAGISLFPSTIPRANDLH
jgi:hypothetical protein